MKLKKSLEITSSLFLIMFSVSLYLKVSDKVFSLASKHRLMDIFFLIIGTLVYLFIMSILLKGNYQSIKDWMWEDDEDE